MSWHSDKTKHKIMSQHSAKTKHEIISQHSDKTEHEIMSQHSAKLNMKSYLNIQTKLNMQSYLNIQPKLNMKLYLNIQPKLNMKSYLNIQMKLNMKSYLNIQTKLNMKSYLNIQTKLNMKSCLNIQPKLNIKSCLNIQPKLNMKSCLNIWTKQNFVRPTDMSERFCWCPTASIYKMFFPRDKAVRQLKTNVWQVTSAHNVWQCLPNLNKPVTQCLNQYLNEYSKSHFLNWKERNEYCFYDTCLIHWSGVRYANFYDPETTFLLVGMFLAPMYDTDELNQRFNKPFTLIPFLNHMKEME